jgi:hypothetical protein
MVKRSSQHLVTLSLWSLPIFWRLHPFLFVPIPLYFLPELYFRSLFSGPILLISPANLFNHTHSFTFILSYLSTSNFNIHFSFLHLSVLYLPLLSFSNFSFLFFHIIPFISFPFSYLQYFGSAPIFMRIHVWIKPKISCRSGSSRPGSVSMDTLKGFKKGHPTTPGEISTLYLQNERWVPDGQGTISLFSIGVLNCRLRDKSQYKRSTYPQVATWLEVLLGSSGSGSNTTCQ